MKDRVMRARRAIAGGCVVAAGVLGLALAATAGASPTVSGNVQQFGPPPSLAKGGDPTTSNCPPTKSPSGCFFRLIYESEQSLSSPQAVDTASPNAYDDATMFDGGSNSSVPAASIPSGTCVDSWFLNWDPGSPVSSLQVDGSVTFQTQILGVDALDGSLDATDATFGNPRSTYPTGAAGRGLEVLNAPSGKSNSSGNPDSFSIDSTSTQLTVHGDADSSDWDQMRVFTACVPTTSTVNIIPRPINYNASTGEAETLKAVVAKGSVDNGPITGQVDWYIDGNEVASAQLRPSTANPSVSNAHVSYTLPPSLTPGYHQIKLVYEGIPPEYGLSSQTRNFLIRDPGALN